MRIGLELAAVPGERTGVGHYAARLAEALLRSPTHEFILYSHRSLEEDGLDFSGATRAEGGIWKRRIPWTHLDLPRLIRRTSPDLCHFTTPLAPLWPPRPYVITVHDASALLYPRYHPLRRRLLVDPLLPLSARRAAAVITVSHAARRDLIRMLDLPPTKVHVVYNAPPRDFEPVTDESRLEATRRKYGLRREFLLYVGTLEPRKNLIRLVRAFAEVRRQGQGCDLVLVGARGWLMRGFREEIQALGIGDAVRFCNYVPTQDLPVLYSLATLFVYPSLYEGFGMPVLEAMASGAPVLAANRSSLPEVCGNSALLVEPDEESLAAGLLALLEDEKAREALRARGLRRAKQFSWDRAASETAAIYELAADEISAT